MRAAMSTGSVLYGWLIVFLYAAITVLILTIAVFIWAR
jgi:hypothetical protein